MSEEWTDETIDSHVICPHCKNYYWIDEVHEYKEEVEDKEDCPSCGKSFIMRSLLLA